MATLEEFLLQEGEEKFKEANKLSEEDSKNDPESEPYKSKYKAREIWHEMKTKLEDIANENQDDMSMVILKGALDLKLGTNYTETDELSTGEELLGKCVEKLEDFILEPKACVTVLQAYNQLGILWTGRRKPAKARDFLKKSRDLYLNYKHDIDGSPLLIDELFKAPGKEESGDTGDLIQKRTENFESLHTHTLYYLAQVYAQMEENDIAAEFCHETLRRQLDSKKYDPFDWSMNCATLSQYYMTKEDFPLARHCLASAYFILQEFGEKPESLLVKPTEGESNNDLQDREKLPKSWADMFRCMTKYGLALLEYSREHLYSQLEEGESHENADTQAQTDQEEEDDEASNKSKLFTLELTMIEDQIPKERVLVFEDARAVFLSVQKWISNAKEFYTMDGQCTDNVEIVQDHSRLFKLLAFFEQDLERQCRMHKRRVDLLQEALNELSPQFYMLICRQLQYEIAETLSAMLDNKLAIIEQTGNPPSQHAVNKINILCQKSLEQYQAYIKTLNDSKTKAAPEKYADEDERPVLIAHFCCGRLYSKFLVFDLKGRLANMKKSMDHYGIMVDYCKRNPDAISKVSTEIELCEEMLTLLPAKMDKMRQQAEV